MNTLLQSAVKAKLVLCVLLFLQVNILSAQTNAWLNEIHYQNLGTDVNETIEIVIENPGTLTDYLVELYDANGNVYASETVNNFQEGQTLNNFIIYYWQPTLIENIGAVSIAYQTNLIPNQFLSYGGTITAMQGVASGLTSTDIGVAESASTDATTSLNLHQQGNAYSDFTWFPSSSMLMQTYGSENINQVIGINSGNPPFFQTITQTPSANSVTSSTAVNINSQIADIDGLASVTLKWGLSSNALNNVISMNLISGGEYKTYSAIPAQTENTTIYYRIEAVDNVNSSATSVLYTYTVLPDPPLGLEISATDNRYFIDFDETVSNVNNGKFKGKGLKSLPDSGELDSDAFKIYASGTSPAVSFGGDYTSLQHYSRLRKGESPGGITAVGFYAFTVESNNNALGVQSGGSDFNSGKIVLRFQNTTGSTITKLALSYKLFEFNDKPRAIEINFSHGISEQSLTQIDDLKFSTQTAVNSNPKWKGNYFKTDLKNLSIPDDGVYFLVWSFKDKSSTAMGERDEFALDEVEIIANPANLTSQLSGNINDAKIIGDVAITDETQLEGNLSITDGELITNNLLTFLSSEEKTATIGNLNSATITGKVTVERFISERRAFRFISSSVNSSESILENWQEGAASNTDNPVPGFGTHITGSASGANGFDATPSGNPSLFTFNNSNQSWNVIPNTNNSFIQAGKAYRLMVRGDRSIDVTSNSAPATDTKLRTQGNLVSGDFSISDLGNLEGEYNFIGNPYQAVVNFESVLANSTNINTNHYYVWNATMAGRGSYETIDLSNNTTAYLQPGQAVFVRTLADGNASILFQENNKVENSLTENTVFSTNDKALISIDLFTEDNIINNLNKSDNVTLNFTAHDSDTILPNDAPKMGNPDENLAIVQGEKFLSLEYRTLPTVETIIPLFANQYRSEHYRFKINVQNFKNLTPYLLDKFTNQEYELANAQQTEVLFTINEASENSIASDRFEIHFKENTLKTKELQTSSIVIYPNPVKNNKLFINSENVSGVQNTIKIYNQLGQLVYLAEKNNNSTRLILNDLNLSSGLFILQLQNKNGSWTKKIVVE